MTNDIQGGLSLQDAMLPVQSSSHAPSLEWRSRQDYPIPGGGGTYMHVNRQ